jgi:hypothetical protein
MADLIIAPDPNPQRYITCSACLQRGNYSQARPTSFQLLPVPQPPPPGLGVVKLRDHDGRVEFL